MDAVKKIENKLEPFFKDLPALPDKSREALANAWPWIALIFGILQLMTAWSLYRLFSWADSMLEFSRYYIGGPSVISGFDRMVIYLGIGVLVADAVILLMAYPQLKKRARRGWDLLFLAALINVGYAVITLFIDDRGFGSFIFGLIGSAVGFYLLFQVRGKFGTVKAN